MLRNFFVVFLILNISSCGDFLSEDLSKPSVTDIPMYATKTEGQDYPSITEAGPDASSFPTDQPAKTDVIEWDVKIPDQSDWLDYGPIIYAGQPGEWDYYLWGGFSFSVIKENSTYFLYYQGASDYRTGQDETVLWRSIGVATSKDGITFTKYPTNPILTWFPNGNGEEGAVSSGVTIGPDGKLYIFYGANTEETAITVNASIRAASSSDGFNFDDLGEIINFKNPAIWGSGDELFPVAAMYDKGRWCVFYIPNGTSFRGQLGVISGKNYNNFDFSSAVMVQQSPLPVWGTAGIVNLEHDLFALVLNNVRKTTTEVRFISLDFPAAASEVKATYQFEGVQQTNLLLDRDRRTWFMYYRTPESYGVKLAPASEKDLTPPSEPTELRINSREDQHMIFSWLPSFDPETGVLQYRIYRDGIFLRAVTELVYSEEITGDDQPVRYQVSAINYHGVESPLSLPLFIQLSDK